MNMPQTQLTVITLFTGNRQGFAHCYFRPHNRGGPGEEAGGLSDGSALGRRPETGKGARGLRTSPLGQPRPQDGPSPPTGAPNPAPRSVRRDCVPARRTPGSRTASRETERREPPTEPARGRARPNPPQRSRLGRRGSLPAPRGSTNGSACSGAPRSAPRVLKSRRAQAGPFSALAKAARSTPRARSARLTASARMDSETATQAPTQRYFTWDEVAQRSGHAAERWLVIDRKVYNISEFCRRHPGGSRVISHYAGQDATVSVAPPRHGSGRGRAPAAGG